MYNFGKTPPRKVRDRGVASLLAADCTVFYDSLFSMMHLGRVTDLLAARLRTEGLDEYRLRTLLLLEFVNAYKAKLPRNNSAVFPVLTDPLVIECGIDSEKIALGICFQSLDSGDLHVEGLAHRISVSNPSNSFERFLSQIYETSDHMVLRADPQGLKFEAVALLAIPGRFEFTKAPMTLELTTDNENFFHESFQPTPAQEYVHLADLDYPTLLREQRAMLKIKEKFATGEALAQDFTAERPKLREIRVKSSLEALPEETFTVKGYLDKSQAFKMNIRGDSQEAPEDFPIHDFQMREAELQKRELAMADTLKHKEDLIRKVKDQLALAHAQIDELRKSNGAADDKGDSGSNFKQRFLAAQRTIQGMQVEQDKLELRINELNRQVLLLQNGPGETTPGELKALKTKHNELMRQHLQLKSLNEQLNARLSAQTTTPPPTPNVDFARDELVRKLEITARLALDQAKELKSLREDLKTAKSALEVSQRMLNQKKAS